MSLFGKYSSAAPGHVELITVEEFTQQVKPRRACAVCHEARTNEQMEQSWYCYTFTFIHLADAFIQSDLQLRNIINDTL